MKWFMHMLPSIVPEVIEQVSNRKPLVHPTETYIAWAGSLEAGQGTTTAYKLRNFYLNTPIPRMM